MGNNSFAATIEVAASPEHVFNCINEITNWWSKEFEGHSAELHDEFIIHHPGRHFSKQKVVELIPGKKIVWRVTESTLNWLKNDQREWTNTKMIFELSARNDKTIIHFTHEGLVPEKECYAVCSQSWTMVLTDWLYQFITAGKTI
jgi:hypothetical protein